MAARQEIRYFGLHQHVSGLCARERLRIRRLLLCYGVLLVISEDEADDELKKVAILTETLGPIAPGVQQHFVGVTWRLSGVGRQVPSQFLQTLNTDELGGLFRGNVTKELGHGIPFCKHPTVVFVFAGNFCRVYLVQQEPSKKLVSYPFLCRAL